LAESREQRRLSPHVLVEHAVDADGGLDSGHTHVELAEVTVVHRLLCAHGLYKKEECGKHGD
jgi:hypothetical protein